MNKSSMMALFITLLFHIFTSTQASALTPDQVFAKVKDSVIIVKTFDVKGNEISQGSGVSLPSGKIATNCHVVKEDLFYQVGQNKHFVKASLYAEDRDKDICLLNVEEAIGKPVELGESTRLKVGVPVYSVGAPKGLELSLSNGIVSQLRGEPPPLIQTTAGISPGSSGGGLFDEDGKLVGLTTLYIEGGQSLNFAIPVEWIRDIKSNQEKIRLNTKNIKTIGKENNKNNEDKTDRKILTDFILNEDWHGMLNYCLTWTKREPDNASAWDHLGGAYIGLKQYKDALNSSRKSLSINPKERGAMGNIGYCYLELGRYQDAIEVFKQVLKIEPKITYTYNWFLLGKGYEKLERYSDAVDAYLQQLKIAPKDERTLLHLGNSYYNLTRYDDALEAYRQIVKINDENNEVWFKIGVTCDALERHNDAIGAWRQVLKITPDDPYAWANLAHSYMALTRNSDAIDAYLQSITIKPDNIEVLFPLGLLYKISKRYPESINTWYQVLKYDPNNTSALLNLGLTYLDTGDTASTLDVVKRLRKIDPSKAEELFNILITR